MKTDYINCPVAKSLDESGINFVEKMECKHKNIVNNYPFFNFSHIDNWNFLDAQIVNLFLINLNVLLILITKICVCLVDSEFLHKIFVL